MQISRCSLSSTDAKPFSSLQKKMKDYIKEYQAIANPFMHSSFPSRPNPSPFAERPKGTPVKRSNMVTRCNIEKLSKPRKINVGYHPGLFQPNWLAKAKEAEATIQAPRFAQPSAMVVIPTQQAEVSVTFIQPATVSAVPTQPAVTSPKQSSGYCATCTTARMQCPTEYPMP